MATLAHTQEWQSLTVGRLPLKFMRYASATVLAVVTVSCFLGIVSR
jgi:hypothetical protein